MPIAPITEIVAEMKAGRMVVLVDEEDRENEGDLVLAADCVTPEAINFMARFGRGLICMPITEERARRLNLAPMAAVNRSVHGTNFTVSIEAAQGVTTGISAADRAHTIRVAAAADAGPEDGAPARSRGLRDRARIEDRLDRRSDPPSQPHRAAGRAHRRASADDARRRIPAGRLSRQALRRNPPRTGARADRPRRRDAGARAGAAVGHRPPGGRQHVAFVERARGAARDRCRGPRRARAPAPYREPAGTAPARDRKRVAVVGQDGPAQLRHRRTDPA